MSPAAAARVVAVVGPTAAGKSELGVAIARALGGAVVNADSMQLYRGMDIGTAKLDAVARAGVPHHLLDIWEVRHAADVADYQRRARATLAELIAAGVLPVVVGGSGLYVRALLDDLRFPGTDPALRRRLEAELAEVGPAALHRRLAGRDPGAAAAVLPGNGRRIVRALEVLELTGSVSARLPAYRPVYPAAWLHVDAADLDRRIADRVARMWRRGLVAETAGLLEHGLAEGRTASRALGYAQVLRLLAGELDETAARRLTVTATRRFARRQRSWYAGAEWLQRVVDPTRNEVIAWASAATGRRRSTVP